MQEQAQAVAAAISEHMEDKTLFLALCAVLEVEVYPADASAIFDAPPEAGHYIKNIEYFRLYEELKISHEKLQELSENSISSNELTSRRIQVEIRKKRAFKTRQ